MYVFGYFMVFNLLVFEVVGFGFDIEDLLGGYLCCEVDGWMLNGVFEEMVFGFVCGVVMCLFEVEQICKVFVDYVLYGVMMVQDGGVLCGQIEGLVVMVCEEELLFDVIVYQVMGCGIEELFFDILVGEYNDCFKFGGIKFVFDGLLQGKIVFLIKLYYVLFFGQSDDYVGYLMFFVEKIDEWVDWFYGVGVFMLVYVNGDVVVDIFIDVV